MFSDGDPSHDDLLNSKSSQATRGDHCWDSLSAMGSKPQQDFIGSVKSEIQPKVYYPFNAPSDLDCLPEGWADYPHHEQLVTDVVAAFIGYAFDLGWNLWETFNVPAEFGASAMSASESTSQSGSSSSGSTLHGSAGDAPTKSTSSSSSTTQKPDPGPKQSRTTTTTTSSTSSADACPTGIEIDPDEDQGQDGPTPTDQIPIVPIATVTDKFDLPCQAHLDLHNDDCNVCTCSGKDTALTFPMSHQTYITPVKGSMITTSDACFYTSWPDTKSISTTSCLDGNQIAQSKSIQSALAENSKHMYPSDFTPGAPIPTCSPDPNHKMPICDLKNGGKDNLPPKYCLCHGPTPSISTPYSTTHTSLVSCDTQLGTVTHLDVCPWTTTPPDSMKIDTTQHGSPYPAGTLPIVQTTNPSCVPHTAGSDQPALLGACILDTARRFCRKAADEKWTVGPGGTKYKFQTYDDADRARNSLGDPRPQRLTLLVQWDGRACPADFDDDHYEFRDFDGCVKEVSNSALKCDRRQMLPKPGDLESVVMFWFGGGYYGNCLWWEVLASDKFRP